MKTSLYKNIYKNFSTKPNSWIAWMNFLDVDVKVQDYSYDYINVSLPFSMMISSRQAAFARLAPNCQWTASISRWAREIFSLSLGVCASPVSRANIFIFSLNESFSGTASVVFCCFFCCSARRRVRGSLWGEIRLSTECLRIYRTLPVNFLSPYHARRWLNM